eukprot:10063596-Alexandrium_andersonii.AAC.1
MTQQARSLAHGRARTKKEPRTRTPPEPLSGARQHCAAHATTTPMLRNDTGRLRDSPTSL